MNLRDLTNSINSINSTNHSTDGADTADTASATDNSVGDMAGNVIIGIFLFVIVACTVNSWYRGGCDSDDTDDGRVHRARCRQAARGQGAYA